MGAGIIIGSLVAAFIVLVIFVAKLAEQRIEHPKPPGKSRPRLVPHEESKPVPPGMTTLDRSPDEPHLPGATS